MHTLRIKLLAPFILGTLTLTLVLTGYAYHSARQALEDAILLISKAKTAQASSVITLLFKSMSTTMHNMVTDPHTLALFAKQRTPDVVRDAEGWLEAITQGNEYYRDILVVDTTGICIASSNPEQIGNDYAGKAYVRQALQGVFNFGDISVGRVTKKFSTVSAGPIDSGGHIVGAFILIADFPKIVDYETDTGHDSRTVLPSCWIRRAYSSPIKT